MRIPGAEEALDHIASWARRGRWKEACASALIEHFEPVCTKAGMDEEEIERLLGENHCAMIEGCAFEDFLARRFGPKQCNIIDDYLDHRGWKESIHGRDYLRALRDSVLSIYEVLDVKRGRGLILHDLIRRGNPIEVDERLGSESAVKWDRLAARVLTIDGRRYLSGAVLHFPPEAADAVVRVFRDAPLRAKDSVAEKMPNLAEDERRHVEDLCSDATMVLADAAWVITSVWLAHTVKQLTAPPPTLTNFDGEQVVFTKVRFPVVKGGRNEVARVLDEAPDLTRESERLCWSWHRQDGEQNRTSAENGISLANWDETGALILGHIELRGKWLVLEVNSRARAERGEEMIGGLLGGLVRKPVAETQSVENALKEHRRSKRAPGDEMPPIPKEEATRAMKEFQDRHYRRVMEEPLPAIGNVSPREAVGSSEGREKVIGWLKYLENWEARRARDEGTPPYDFTWMWRELRVLDARR
jgi:hypothetical protein